MPRRILVLGATGMDKRSAIGQIGQLGQDLWHRPAPWMVRFEDQYLRGPTGKFQHYHFLSNEQTIQADYWDKAWDRFSADLSGHANDDVILSMHGVIVWRQYGVRTLVNPVKVLEQFKPDVILTFIDDVYDQWWRTEFRAKDLPVLGRPTLEQLISAPRGEVMIGDQIAHLGGRHVPHYTIAMSHPAETAARLAYGEDPFVVYLCFPISSPRRMEAKGDRSGIEEVNKFLKQAYQVQADDRSLRLCFICPLTIDELPLREAYLEEKRSFMEDVRAGSIELPKGSDPERLFLEQKAIKFDRDALRWSTNAEFPESLGGIPPPEWRIPIPAEQLEPAAGMLYTEVGWRDFRLVTQAHCVAAFNPRFHSNKISRSVLAEIRTAGAAAKPILLYQDPSLDQEGLVKREFEAGTMGPDAGTQMVMQKDTLDEVFASISALGKI